MKQMLAMAAFCLFLGTQCQKEDKKPLLFGKWQAISWKVNGTESNREDSAAVQFEFNADDTYKAQYGSQTESGTYRLSGDKLYTIGENKIEKAVKLATLKADTIVMDMNRVGTAETLTLVKK
jgi:Lipocalin-like domain